jgi:DNA-binding LacI/PurR family transcriptional regulator
MALGLLRALHEAGRRVPDDVSVVGFDDIPEAEYFGPPLTTVRQHFDELGRRALGSLMTLIDTGITAGDPSTPHVSIEPSLVVRGSATRPRT